MFTVNIETLSRIVNVASNDSTRPYLHGVHVTTMASGAVVLVATDGHALACEHDLAGECTIPGTVHVAAIKQIVTAAKHYAKLGRLQLHNLQVQIWERETQRGANLIWGDVTTPIHVVGQLLVDGTFPEFRRILPDVKSENAGTKDVFNSELMATLAKSMPKGDKAFRMFQADAGYPALVRSLSSQWFGVIMPMRSKIDDIPIPGFITAQPKAMQKAA